MRSMLTSGETRSPSLFGYQIAICIDLKVPSPGSSCSHTRLLRENAHGTRIPIACLTAVRTGTHLDFLATLVATGHVPMRTPFQQHSLCNLCACQWMVGRADEHAPRGKRCWSDWKDHARMSLRRCCGGWHELPTHVTGTAASCTHRCHATPRQ